MKFKYYNMPLFAAFIYANALTQPFLKIQRVAGGSDDDELICMAITRDGGFIAGGDSYSDSSGEKTESNRGTQPVSTTDYWIVKYDSELNIQWDKTIGGNDNDVLLSIQQTSDDGYILGGYSFSDISGEKTDSVRWGWDYWIVKLDSKGNIQWDKTIGGGGSDVCFSVRQTSDGGYIAGGYSSSNISGEKTDPSRGGFDYWIVKLNSKGKIQWDKTIGGNSDDIFYGLQQTSDGGYILGGYSASKKSGEKTTGKRGGDDYWVVKLDIAGNIEWDKTIGGNDNDNLQALQQTSDGGFILGGFSSSNISHQKTENSRGKNDYWLVKLNRHGKIQWDKTIGGNQEDDLTSLQQTQDGGYILGGSSFSNISGEKTEISRGLNDYWIVKLDKQGKIQWDKTIGGDNDDGNYELSSVIVKEIGLNRYIVGGYSTSKATGDKNRKSRGGGDYWLVGLLYKPGKHSLVGTTGNIASITVLNTNTQSLLVYPNPAKDILHIQSNTKITISLVDASGKIVLIQTINGKSEINISRLKSGVYFVKNHATGEVKKVVVEK